ncbi:PP2C family protein-serine/threonine phosphatase [Actinosynnema sp. CS-041913]|uniref:PP2C family protein-serine/threonine phosphatase n=1 Tax=Actinosynnema sp. CS-041913 TaxID=3239917 RepID=UPI003D92C2BF
MKALTAAAGSRTGRRYSANYDVAHLSTDPLLAVVADGMGDGPGSTMASRTAVDLLVAGVRSGGSITDAVATAQRRVGDYGRRIGGLAGCTLTALVESPDGLWAAQLGDSRLYRLRSGLLELLTVDHTMAWLGAVNGWYAFDSPQAASARYQLTRYIGHPGEPEPDLLKITPRPGDVFLLCTDGVAEQVPYHRILETLSQQAGPDTMVRTLLDLADAAGGNDNATAVVVSYPSAAS